MSPQPIRIAIVDDAEDLRLVLTLVFGSDWRFEVVGEASDGVEAIRLVREKRPDLLLLDVEMPRMNGLEVLDHLLDDPDAPVVVVLSGVSRAAGGEQALARGAHGYFPKTVDPHELVDDVHRVFEERRASGHRDGERHDDGSQRLTAGGDQAVLRWDDGHGTSDPVTAVADLAAAVADVPVAVLSLLDGRRWISASPGSSADGDLGPLLGSASPDALPPVVEDLWSRPDAARDPLVAGAPHLRAAATIPLVDAGVHLGVLRVLDTRVRAWDEGLLGLLGQVADQAVEMVHQVRSQRDEVRRLTDRSERLESAIAERTEFLAIAQHKLKTPLAIVAGWASTLDRWDLLRDQDRADGIGAIQRAASELQRQIEDLLDEARAHMLGEALRPVSIQLATFLADEVTSLRTDPERHPVSVDVPTGLVVRADPSALHDVFAHLLDNAVKYSPDGGAVVVTASARASTVRISVRDHGIGLDVGDTDVFRPFERGQLATTVARGTGLGLHIVRNLVVRMDGAVGHVAPAQGAGAVVWFELPAG